MDLKRPRKLDLNAPLLSTRRLGFSVVADKSSNSLSTVQNAGERVPFSWEQAPGKPKKDIVERSDSGTGTPRPTLPPCLWIPPKEEASEADDVHSSDHAFHDQDKDDVFSDAMDVFSLSEALDIVQKKSENVHSHDNNNNNNNDGLRLKLAESNGYQSPTYMINRFLPDATALAASSSALDFHHNLDKKDCDNTCSYQECYLSGSARHSYASSSPKGCGFELLFPWRMKHKLCAMKNPVLPCSTNLQKHQHRSKQKKHRSFAHMTCTNVREDI